MNRGPLASYAIASWNINGNLLSRSVFLKDFLSKCDIVCIQEHFANTLSLSLLELSTNHKVFSVAARRSQSHGRPCGGLATYVKSCFTSSVFDSASDFLAVRIQNVVVLNVYLPTNYRDDRSERLFAISVARLSKCLGKIKEQGLCCIVTGDFNCDLTDSLNSSGDSVRPSIIFGLFDDDYLVAPKNKSFTYVHNSGSTSNLDHVCHTRSVTIVEVGVSDSSFTSDHFPLFFSARFDDVGPSFIPFAKKRSVFYISDWDRASSDLFQNACNDILAKIRVPFDLLMRSSKQNMRDSRIRLNLYCSELTHALSLAEKSAVPIRRVKSGTEEPGWSTNSNLRNACFSAKFWLSVWIEADKPRDGWLRKLYIYTKRQFAKQLSLHRNSIISSCSEEVRSRPNKLWSSLVKEAPSQTPSLIPLSSWIEHYKKEFSAPDPHLQNSYKARLQDFFEHASSPGPIITKSLIISAIGKLKKKKSRGYDGISAQHLSLCGGMFIEHLVLLYQMIFNLGIVPDSFSIGCLTPIPKKNKPPSDCSSFRPITVSTVFCKIFENLIIEELRTKCTVQAHQFGFQSRLGCGHALSALVSALVDAEDRGESIALATHDVRRAFDSLLHEEIILDMGLAGVDPCSLAPLADMYENLKAELKLPLPASECTSLLNDVAVSPRGNPLLPVKKGVRQGAISSPTAFNNSIVKPQSKSLMTYILRGVDLSLIGYADDVLNLSRFLQGLEDNFTRLQQEYAQIGLQFNADKSEVLLFNSKSDAGRSITLGVSTVGLAGGIVYLGLPIGRSILETRRLLLSHFQKRVSFTYSRIVANKRKFDRRLLARVYNAMVLPHYLYLSPFWRIFTATDRLKLRSVYYKYAKFLLRLPPWTSNRYVSHRYGIMNPEEAILAQITRYNLTLKSHPWAMILQQ